MPLYEYECKQCGSRFERLIFNRGAKVKCKACGGGKVAQLLSTFAIASSGSRSNPVDEAGPCGSCGAADRGSCGFKD